MDVLDEILGSLRLSGGVVIDGEFSGDFCVNAEFTPGHFEPFFPVPETLMSYHYVRSGTLIVEVDGMPPVTLEAGDVAILPRNDPHRLSNRAGVAPTDASKISKVTADGVHRVTTGTDGPKAEVWCGFLTTAKDSEHPLLEALPSLLTLNISGGEAEWLESSMRFLAEEHPSPEVVARLAEVFVAQAVREYVESVPAGATGWLRGLADPAVSRALSMIHTRYNEELDVEMLAREAGVSRTVLGERFAELLGEPPMRYCSRWRMHVAANMLRDGKQSTANIAYSVGFNSEAAFNRAFKREFGEPPATWRRRVEAESAAEARVPIQLPRQLVRYCAAHDGTRLAFSAVGEGPPLVKAANWLNHLEHDWKSPVWKHWLQHLTDGHCLIRYDERGNGMSDWDTPELSFEAFVDDLASVVDYLGLEQFDLLGVSQGAAVAVAYAVRHPERVRRMVLYGGYSRGWAVRAEPGEVARREALIALTETGWGADLPAYRQVFTNIYIPEGNPRQVEWFNELQKVSASPENAARIQRVLSTIDVTDLLPKVTVPTLVLHAREDQAVPFLAGEEMAARIPGARFVPLEGENHILLETEPAWPVFAKTVCEFLDAKGELPSLKPAGKPRPKQKAQVGSCAGADGKRIGFAVTGEGFPIVKAPNSFTHLEHDGTNPIYRHWISECSRANRLVRCDMRGFGMSDWDPGGFTTDALVSDLTAVVDASGVERFDLIGLAHAAPIAIAYAARNPERVRKLVLVNGFAAGWAVRGDPDEIAWRESLRRLNEKRWKRDGVALGELFVSIYFPVSAAEMVDWHKERFDEMGPAENLEAMLDWGSKADVRGELAEVRAETLVFHARSDGTAPLEVGAAMAEGIRGSRFVELESANHFILGDEPAWPVLVRELRAFLAGN